MCIRDRVKHAIQYNFHMVFMKYMAYFGEIIVSSKAAVYLFEIVRSENV